VAATLEVLPSCIRELGFPSSLSLFCVGEAMPECLTFSLLLCRLRLLVCSDRDR